MADMLIVRGLPVMRSGRSRAALSTGNVPEDDSRAPPAGWRQAPTSAGKQVPPFQLNVSLAPIFEFAAAMQDEDAGAAVREMAKGLAEAKGKDHVTLIVSPQPNAIRIRLTAEEGVLQLLGTAFKNAQAGGGVPGLGN